jgi:hypothetical protein
MSYEGRTQIPPKVRAEILVWLGNAQRKGVKLEKQKLWQSAMQLAWVAGDVPLLCELTRHWDWKKMQRKMRQTFERAIGGLK